MDKNKDSQDYSQPVAYDTNGNPLYAHPMPESVGEKPSEGKAANDSQNEIIKMKHERSVQAFPNLDLGEKEYVIRVIERNPIGLFPRFFVGAIIILLASVFWANIEFIFSGLKIDLNLTSSLIFSLLMLFTIIMAIIWMYTLFYVYSSNKLFLTTDSVIQEIRTSIFANDEQIVGLGNIEDVSYTQHGIFEQIFNFGSISLSKEGETTHYTLKFARDPRSGASAINEAMEDFRRSNNPNLDEGRS